MTALQTYPSRTQWNLLAPRAEDVIVEDIAHSLAGIPRYNAHTHTRYSVAQHSVYVLDVLARNHDEDYPGGLPAHSQGVLDQTSPEQIFVTALFHDGHEAYLGDLTAPLKHALRAIAAPYGLQSPLDWLEARHDEAIFTAIRPEKWGPWLPSPDQRQIVHTADVLAYEMESSALRCDLRNADLGRFYDGRILDPAEARELFLARARELGVGGG